MSKKLSDLDKEEKRNLKEELEGISSSMGMEPWESYSNMGSSALKEAIGICFNCKNLNYCKTEFLNVHAVCTEFDFRLSGQNRITECNVHSPKGVLSLQEMYAMAYIIDDNEEKKVKGFVTK